MNISANPLVGGRFDGDRHASGHIDRSVGAPRPRADGTRRARRVTAARPPRILSGMATPEALSILYALLVAGAAAGAMGERLLALRHERRLRAEGADEIEPWVFRLMVPVYALVFPAAIAEHVLLHRRPFAGFAFTMVALFLAAKGLKVWAIRSLGDLWTMRVLLPRRLRVVTSGPYRYVRHPNYVAVLAEVAALPLAGGAWITAAAGGALFLVLLRARVAGEEKALLTRTEYAAGMRNRPRFLPGGGP